MGRWVNDSKFFPNAKIKKITFKGTPYLCLFALKDIVIGEELAYFYGVDGLEWHAEVCKNQIHYKVTLEYFTLKVF